MKLLPSRVSLFCLFTIISTPAVAGEMNESVYFDATRRSDGKIEVKFVLSRAVDGSRSFVPIRGYALVPDIPQKQCGIQKTDDYWVSKEHLSAPLYDFADKSKQIPAEKLPVFFAIVISAELVRTGLTRNNEESLPYHTCTRILWTQLLGLQRK